MGNADTWTSTDYKRLCAIVLSRCSAGSNHGLKVVQYMGRANPAMWKAKTCMSDSDYAAISTKYPEAIAKADEIIYTTLSAMMAPNSDGATLMNTGVDTDDIPIGSGFVLLEKLNELFQVTTASVDDVDILTRQMSEFSALFLNNISRSAIYVPGVRNWRYP